MVGGEGDDHIWGSGHGAIAVWGSGRGAIARCHCWVPCSVLCGRGAIAGCHCSVLWLGGVTTNFEGVDVVPLLEGEERGAIAGCHCSVLWFGGC